MKTVVVVSNLSQLKAVEARAASGEAAVYCDNPAFYGELEKRKIGFTRLDEFLLVGRWSEANAWGCQKAADWIRVWREEVPEAVNLAEVVFLHFGYTLVQAAKNRLLAEWLVEKGAPQKITVFESLHTRRYPEFSGNAFLNVFLKDLASQNNIAIETIPVSGEESLESQSLDARPKLARRILGAAKWALKRIYSKTASRSAHVDVLAFGSLRHLAPVLDALKEKGLTVAVYDFDLHKDQFEFARSRGLRYLIPDLLPAPDLRQTGVFADDLEIAFKRVMARCRREWFFKFDRTDLSSFVETQVFKDAKAYFMELGRQHGIYSALAERVSAKAVLVDEDFGPRSYFVSFMTNQDIASWCVSHANLAVDFSVPEESRLFGKSTTFVHSEFERAMYAARGWNPGKIEVSGTPRYDTLIRKAAAKVPGANRPLRLLCVGSGLFPQTADTIGYLGCHVFCQGEPQEIFLDAVFEAIGGLDVRAVIKPHDLEDEPIWRRLAKASRVADQVEVAPSAASFVDLLLDSDALVLSFWSNTMVESAIAGKPVFYLDLPPQHSPILSAWSGQGYSGLLPGAAALRRELEKLLKSGLSAKNSSKDAYYLGRKDGLSAARAANAIVLSLSGRTEAPTAAKKFTLEV